MNANELAEIIEHLENARYIGASKAAEMLRQQQNEIEDLKSANRFIQNFAEEQHKRAVALEMRELTDEEIWEVVSLKWWDWEDSFDVTGFARAILRKAQEK